MGLVFLVGGARSGKTALALGLAADSGGPVVVVATGEARDEEMAARIERHRAERPQDWSTLEVPVDLTRALAEAPEDACVVVDCLTLWTSNALEAGWSDEAVERRRASSPGSPRPGARRRSSSPTRSGSGSCRTRRSAAAIATSTDG